MSVLCRLFGELAEIEANELSVQVWTFHSILPHTAICEPPTSVPNMQISSYSDMRQVCQHICLI